MSHPQPWHASRWSLASLCLIVLLSGTIAQPSRAADLGKLDTSLQWVPAEAAFYGSMLRNREQIDAVLKSRAWAQLKSVPAIQFAWQMAEKELSKPGGALAELEKFQAQPENKELLELLGDMAANEVFCYGGANSAELAQLAMQVFGGARYGPAFMQLTGAAPVDPSKALALAALRALAASQDLIKPPELVIGFKLGKTQSAENQLLRLEKLLTALTEQLPQLKGRLQRVKVGGGSFLTLAVNGAIVPWEQIPWKDLEQKPGEFDALQKKLKELTLTLSVGIRGNYLLVSVGESTAHLARLGQGQRLVDRPEFKPLARFADRRLTSIGYSSKNLNTRVTTNKMDLDEMVTMANAFLAQADLTAAQRDRIAKDLQKLADDLKKYIPEAGPTLSFSFLTERGSESYAFDWGEHPGLDGSKPLTLLNHVGGTPILAVVGRARQSIEPYQLLVKWLKVGNGYVEELLVPKLDPDQKQKYKQYAKIAHPLLGRLDEVTSKLLLPALADGQSALVLDARLTSRQWHPAMPAAAKPLPILEPALVVGVSDAALLEKAFREYRSLANEAIAKARELEPRQVPEFQIPPPETRKLKAGTVYFNTLPPQLGLDAKIVPNAALSDKVAVLSISQEHSERLLTATPLSAAWPIGDGKRPLASAVYFDATALLDALAPWLETGIRLAGPSIPPVPGVTAGDNPAEDLIKQTQTVLKVLKVFRSHTSCSYFEDGALVTHSATVIQDL